MSALALLILAGCGERAADSGTSEVPRFVAVEVGSTWSCGLRSSRQVECWGNPQVGDENWVPTPDVLLDGLSCGHNHCCGLDGADEPRCWGSNFYGQSDPPAPVFLVSVSTGFGTSGGIDASGFITGWGVDPYAGWAEDLNEDGPWEGLQLQNECACAWDASGRVSCENVQAGGWSTYDFAFAMPIEEAMIVPDLGLCARLEDASVVCDDGSVLAEDAADLDVGEFGYMVVHDDGTVSEQATAEMPPDNVPPDLTPPTDLDDAITVATDWNHACALRASGDVACWGEDYYGETTPPP